MSSNSILLEAMYVRVLAPIYYACTNHENYLRAIIISLVGKYVVNTIRGQNLFEEIRYIWNEAAGISFSTLLLQ